MLRTSFMSRALPLVATLALLGCEAEMITDGSPTSPSGGTPALVISDGAHGGGNAHFYFLPPMVRQPAYSGTFDGTLTPVVRVTQGATVLVSLNAVADPLTETYQANWHAGDYALDPALTYRINVLVGTQELGFADVDVVAKGSELRDVNTGEYIGLINGRTLPIKFRIERGALVPGGGLGLIVFQTWNGAWNEDIYSIAPDGSGLRQLTAAVASPGSMLNADIQPSLSRNGSRVIFVSLRSGSHQPWVMNADGSGLTQFSGFGGSWTYTPVWSPDDGRILYAHNTGGAATQEIWVINADGTGRSQLTFNGASDDCPAWAPDGTRALFNSQRDGNDEIYVMNADGSNPVRLTTNVARDFCPQFSPDGARVVFGSGRSGNNEIWVMNSDGSAPVQLTFTAADNINPVWSPDGSMIVFSSDRVGGPGHNLWLMNADGTGARALTSGLIEAVWPSWR